MVYSDSFDWALWIYENGLMIRMLNPDWHNLDQFVIWMKRNFVYLPFWDRHVTNSTNLKPSGPVSCHQTGEYQVSMDSTDGQWVPNIPVPHKWTWYSLNYVSNVTIARTRTLLSLSWILLWNVSGWLWPLSRMTWTLFVIAWLLKRKFWGFNLTISSHSML